jgi:hypothetical protein
VVFDPNGLSFGNLGMGPLISILDFEQKQNTLENLLDRGLIVTAYITDTKHPAFDIFRKEDARTNKQPVAVFITAYYLEHYYD